MHIPLIARAKRAATIQIGNLFQVIGGLLMAAAILEIGLECLVWLRTAQWQMLPLGVVLLPIWDRLPDTSGWAGADELIEWVLKVPLSVVVLILGWGFVLSGAEMKEGA